jgi:hypothetical protein
MRELFTPSCCRPALTEEQNAGKLQSEQLQYPRFLAQCWPIGSGIIESGNHLILRKIELHPGMQVSHPLSKPLQICTSTDAVWFLLR